MGPYDRRTIVGMRIKKTLTSQHELVTAEGARLTVADLLGAPPRDNNFQPNRSGSYSLVQARYSAALVSARPSSSWNSSTTSLPATAAIPSSPASANVRVKAMTFGTK